jgi:hypothetical protein
MMSVWRRSKGLTDQEQWAVMWWLIAQSDTVALRRAMRQADSAAKRNAGPDLKNDAAYYRDVANAHLALARRDTALALRLLLAIGDTGCRTCSLHRLTTARLLAALGRLDDAERWLLPRPDPMYEPGPVTILWCLEQARVAERLGKKPEAIEDYWYVANMWQHADSVLLPYVAESRAALERLHSDR